ncbi:MAG: Hachiman antiphage defense system protein HamA [Janthinobacterium lividum]
MSTTPQHIQWFADSGMPITTNDGRVVQVWEFKYVDDASIYSEWAKHFRNQYCSDDEIDDLRAGTGLSRSEYLKQLRFPARDTKLGPGIRAGDFAEILVSDYLQYTQGYWVPRTRYNNKTVRDESTKGSDIIGFKYKYGSDEVSEEDILVVFESKTQFSGDKPQSKLNEAIKDSAKDSIRLGESLNAIKQRLKIRGVREWASISRFQNQEDNPFIEYYGAVVILSTNVFNGEDIKISTTEVHPQGNLLKMLVIHGINMMDLVHKVYDLACDCDES